MNSTEPSDDLFDTGSDDATWILTSGFIILTMQSGFGLLETGFVSPSHEVNVMMKNVVDVVCGGLSFWAVGYGISFGEPSNPLMGTGKFFVGGGGEQDTLDDPASAADSGMVYANYLFHFAFASTATTIVSGCVAGRMRFRSYIAFSFINSVIYAFPAHWFWGGNGWLARLGVHDFAGDGPVHLLGACMGLVGSALLGPREGRFEPGGKARYRMSSPTNVIFGLFVLWWGWIGFNCGSTFGITGNKWIVACRVSVTTLNASCAGGLASLAISLRRFGLYDVEMVVNGILGSLVAITAPCAVCTPIESLAIGAAGGIAAIGANDALAARGLDDPVGAIGVHGASAVVGLLSVGLFADSALVNGAPRVADGLLRGGGFRLLGVQCAAALVVAAWALATSWLAFGALRLLCGDLRVSRDEERRGMDVVEHGLDSAESSRTLLQSPRSPSSPRLSAAALAVVDAAGPEETASSPDQILARAERIQREARHALSDLIVQLREAAARADGPVGGPGAKVEIAVVEDTDDGGVAMEI